MIVKHGNTYKEIICPHCGAILGVGDADLFSCDGDPVDIWCEECGEKIKIKDIH